MDHPTRSRTTSDLRSSSATSSTHHLRSEHGRSKPPVTRNMYMHRSGTGSTGRLPHQRHGHQRSAEFQSWNNQEFHGNPFHMEYTHRIVSRTGPVMLGGQPNEPNPDDEMKPPPTAAAKIFSNVKRSFSMRKTAQVSTIPGPLLVERDPEPLPQPTIFQLASGLTTPMPPLRRTRTTPAPINAMPSALKKASIGGSSDTSSTSSTVPPITPESGSPSRSGSSLSGSFGSGAWKNKSMLFRLLSGNVKGDKKMASASVDSSRSATPPAKKNVRFQDGHA